MSIYAEKTLKELFDMADTAMGNVHKNVAEEFYPNLKDEEHRLIKVYQAIDRTKMYVASKLLSETFYSFSLESLVENKDRKSLIKIIEGLKDVDYAIVRDIWHKELKEIFYIQKEDRKLQAKLSAICILARAKVDDKEGFVRIVNGKLSIEQSIAMATEFPAINDEDSGLEFIEDIIMKETGIAARAFFNNKKTARSVFRLSVSL